MMNAERLSGTPVAVVGTRQPAGVPPERLQLFLEAVRAAARRGQVLHAGAAVGAERLAVEAALTCGGSVRLFLPWAQFERDWVNSIRRQAPERVEVVVFDSNEHPDWLAAARSFDPQARYYSTATAAGYARQCGIIQGCEMVIALPHVRVRWERVQEKQPAGWFGRRGRAASVAVPVEDRGSTEQQIRLATYLGAKVVDLSRDADRESLQAWVEIRSNVIAR
jgi:hypothetical protein